jgi:hypothetical protein
MAPTRRQILTGGLLGAAALAVGGIGGAAALGLRPGILRAPPRPPQVLDPAEYSVMAAVADRMVRGEGLDAEALEVALRVDDILATLHPAAVAEIRQVLVLLENALAGFLLEGRTVPFTAAPPAVQDRVLAGWAEARIPVFRTAYRGLHGLCMAAAWSRQDLYALVDYPGPPPLHGRIPATPTATVEGP